MLHASETNGNYSVFHDEQETVKWGGTFSLAIQIWRVSLGLKSELHPQ